ncbi:MAG: DUF362 domain-containing protein [Anaerolineae bacterium]|nr:DUF362 domain-containing protein [Anaerolineae bacterium]
MPASQKPQVRAVFCDHRATDEEVYSALKRATDPLTRAWAKLEKAERITIKFNQCIEPNKLVRFHGNFQELVDPKVARALLRLLRERTHAEIICTDVSSRAHSSGLKVEDTLSLLPVLREFDVPFINGNEPPLKTYPVPGGGLMFRQYLLSPAAVETDAFISVQKMKNHAFMGITLCLKNLFGLPPTEPHGRSRRYFHHLVRLPYVIADLGQIVQPTLSVIDALVGQAGREWGGEGRICNTLIAGDQVVATDACGTYLMGHDPLADWPQPPFLRDRNALLVAHESGFGTADLSAIDFQSEVEPPVASFFTYEIDPQETIAAWLRSTCEQALYYRDNREKFIEKYAGEYILLQDYEVVWHDRFSEFHQSRRDLAGPRKKSALWFKLVDPEEAEGEHFEVYERTLALLKEKGF